ncbi:hypothetical protein BB561_006780 [Smittium simulii]|uniref:Uncharacterized protein n=1 Tax=Smittium simulii TaxID=133385 RepID=A0A2T9Y1M5_9FUNG|nr:hypothetical protein BB561_006780 [Smittium simulii]
MSDDLLPLLEEHKTKTLASYTQTSSISPFSFQGSAFWFIPADVDFPCRKLFPFLESFFYLVSATNLSELAIIKKVELIFGYTPINHTNKHQDTIDYSKSTEKKFVLEPTQFKPIKHHLAQSCASKYAFFSSSCDDKNLSIRKNLVPLIIYKINLQCENEYLLVIPNSLNQPHIDDPDQNQTFISDIPSIMNIKTTGSLLQTLGSDETNFFNDYAEKNHLFLQPPVNLDINCCFFSISDIVSSNSLDFDGIDQLFLLPGFTKSTLKNSTNLLFHPRIKLRHVGSVDSTDSLTPYSAQSSITKPQLACIQLVIPPLYFTFCDTLTDTCTFSKNVLIFYQLYKCYTSNSEYKNPFIKNYKKLLVSDQNIWIKQYSLKIDALIQCTQKQTELEQTNLDKSLSQNADFLDCVWDLMCQAHDQNDIIDLYIAICDAFEQLGSDFKPNIRESNTLPLADLISKRSLQSHNSFHNKELDKYTQEIIKKIHSYIDDCPPLGMFYIGYSKIVQDYLEFFSKSIYGIKLGINSYFKTLIQKCPENPENLMNLIYHLYCIKKTVCYILSEFGLKDQELQNISQDSSEIQFEDWDGPTQKREFFKCLISEFIGSYLNHHFFAPNSSSNNFISNKNEFKLEYVEYSFKYFISCAHVSNYKVFKNLIQETCTVDWISIYSEHENMLDVENKKRDKQNTSKSPINSNIPKQMVVFNSQPDLMGFKSNSDSCDIIKQPSINEDFELIETKGDILYTFLCKLLI